MSGFTFLNPIGLAALSSLAIVGLIYLFYKRHKPRVISGLFLFDRQEIWQKSGRKLAKPRTSRSLVLDILACLLLSLAVAGPTYLFSYGSDVAIILDTSLSMRAGENNQRAKAQALELIATHGAGGRLTIITAGRIPNVTAALGAPMGTYRNAIRNYDPFDASSNISAAVALAKQSTPGNVTIHLFTDKTPTLKKSPQTNIVVHTLKGAYSNLALVDTVRQVNDVGQDELVLAVANYSSRTADGTLIVSKAEGTISKTPFSLKPMETFRGVIPLPEQTGPVAVDLQAEPSFDKLKADSHADLLPQNRRRVTYAISPTLLTHHPIERALEAAGAIPAKQSPDLLITDSTVKSGEVATLQLVTSNNENDGFIGPFVVDSAHPLCRDVDLQGVYWVPADTRLAQNGIPLISVGNHPLYYQSRPERLHLNLDLAAGNLTKSPAWPILFAGIVDYTNAISPGLHQVNYHSGDALRFVPSASEGHHARRLTGSRTDIPWPSPKTPPRLPTRPGRYELVQDDVPFASIAVNPLSPKESDLTGLASTDQEQTLGKLTLEQSGTDHTSVAWILVLVALILFTLNWILTKREL